MDTIDELRSTCLKASCELEKLCEKDSNVRVLKNDIRNIAIKLLWEAEGRRTKYRFYKGDFVKTNVMWKRYYPHICNDIGEIYGVVCGRIGEEAGFHLLVLSTKHHCKEIRYVHPGWLERCDFTEMSESGYFDERQAQS